MQGIPNRLALFFHPKSLPKIQLDRRYLATPEGIKICTPHKIHHFDIASRVSVWFLLHDVSKVADLTLKGDHQMIPRSAALEMNVIVVLLYNLPIVIHLLPDGKLTNPQGGEVQAAPATESGGKWPSLREVVCAEYPSICL
jgi:hypothetical protein